MSELECVTVAEEPLAVSVALTVCVVLLEYLNANEDVLVLVFVRVDVSVKVKECVSSA